MLELFSTIECGFTLNRVRGMTKTYVKCTVQISTQNTGTIEFKNYFKQISLPFKIYNDFKCNLKSAENYEGSYSRKYRDHVACSFAYKLVCIDDELNQ